MSNAKKKRKAQSLPKVDELLLKTSAAVTAELKRRQKQVPITEAGLLNDLIYGKY